MRLGDAVRVTTRDAYNGRAGWYAGTHLGEVGVDFRTKIPEGEKPRAQAYFRPRELEVTK